MRVFIRSICRIASTLALAAVMVSAAAAAESGGSYDSITEDIGKPNDWRQIVADSPFRLGEPTPAGYVNGVEIYELGYGTYPSVDGSTVAVPMAMEFARQHLGLGEDDLYSFVFLNTTHSAYENLILKKPNRAPQIPSMYARMDQNHPVDLMIGTEPSDEELALAAENGVELVKIPACLDAFVFIVNADNPVDNLSLEQIRGIYAGDITSWQEVGGAPAAIEAYQREKNSGSQTAMENLVMKGAAMDGALPNYTTSGMEGLVYAVGDYENGQGAIGYTYLYYLNELIDGGGVKAISVNGVAPTAENIRSGEYAFSTYYYAVYRREDADAAGGKFADWIASAEGQACVGQAGYISLEAKGAEVDAR
ncbi:MAG: substrate-binding domain-containing protein [Oscillospiraceae bacterium]|jgi:phosphate transport system substrate-binding protein|nr:substrate-binding domain-containing protein [Oscillospiraceae bacterium]